MTVLVFAALLEEYDLVETRFLEAAHVGGDFVGGDFVFHQRLAVFLLLVGFGFES